MVRNHRLFNKKFNRAGTRASTRPRQTRPGGRCGPSSTGAEIIRNHQFFNKKFNIAGTRARPQPRQTRPGGRQAAAAAKASLLKLIREQKKRCANRTRLPKADTPRLREGCTTRKNDCRITKAIRQSTRTECDRVEQSQNAMSEIDNTSRSRHARTTGRCDKSKRHMCKARRRDAKRANTKRKLPRSSAGRSGLRPTKQRRPSLSVSPKCERVGSRRKATTVKQRA